MWVPSKAVSPAWDEPKRRGSSRCGAFPAASARPASTWRGTWPCTRPPSTRKTETPWYAQVVWHIIHSPTQEENALTHINSKMVSNWRLLSVPAHVHCQFQRTRLARKNIDRKICLSPECGRRFQRSASFRAHLALHEENDNLTCPHCEKELPNEVTAARDESTPCSC